MYIKIYYYTIHNKIYYYQWQVQQQVLDKQQVSDKWRDACKLPKFIKFSAVTSIKQFRNYDNNLRYVTFL